MPPTSHDFAAEAAICGTPGGKDAELGLQSELRPPALLARDVERQRPVQRRLVADLDLGQRLLHERPQPRRPSVMAERDVATIGSSHDAVSSSLVVELLGAASTVRAGLAARFAASAEMRVRKWTNDSWSIDLFGAVDGDPSSRRWRTRRDVDDLLDPAGTPRHIRHAIGEVHRFLDRVR